MTTKFRITLPLKTFSAFFSLVLLFSLSAYFIWFGIGSIRNAARQYSDLKDFQIALRGVENFNTGASGRSEESRQTRFEKAFSELSDRTANLRRLSGGIPAEARDNLPLLDEQLAYFRRAYEDLLQKQVTDESLHHKQHQLMEELALKLGEPSNTQMRSDFSKILYHWGRAYHDRDVTSISALHAIVDDARKRALDLQTLKLLGEVEKTLDKNYLNYLALIEREDFLSGTTKRYVQLSNQALTTILAFEEREQSKMAVLVIGAVAASLLLTVIFWVLAMRYINDFLQHSTKMVAAIRKGETAPAPATKKNDEFGDLLGFIEDMGETLNQTMHSVKTSEEKYRALTEELSDWIWESDLRGHCTYTSPVGAKILGIDEDKILGAPMGAILCTDEEDSNNQECLQTLDLKVEGREIVSHAVQPDGKSLDLESSWRPRKGPDGSIQGLRGITRNVTERLALEKEKREMQDQLVHAQKMEAIGTLSGGVAHDFNNMLQAIGGYADLLLLRDRLEERDRKIAQEIAGTAITASRLTKQLLLFSRRAQTQMAPLNLNAELIKVSEMMERLLPREVALKVETCTELPPILGDQMQVEQILINLIINARDAVAGHGTITVRAQTESDPSGAGNKPGKVVLSVSDNGIGMAEEVKQRIFEPFFTTKEPGKGTGLGLSIVYGIVKSHNATLTFDSTVGKGTTFEIKFPALGNESEKAQTGESVAKTHQESARHLKILIADDERGIIESCGEIFSLGGHETITASTGEEALEKYTALNAGKIDLVILDISMPGMGGIECFKKIKERNPDQPIILASGYTDTNLLGILENEKTCVFLKKPFRLNSLLETARKLCG